MQISVFGTGYVGLVTGTCFAEMGNDVICADISHEKIDKLKTGFCPIYEPGLEELIKSNLKAGRLSFTTDAVQAVKASPIIFIAVGTPSGEDGSADLKHVLQVAESIALHMDGYRTVITKSTVPVGSSSKIKEVITHTLKSRNVSFEFDVISNPEFLKEGTAVEDCLKPSRVIIGCETERARKQMEKLYDPFLRNGHPLFFMDLPSSEMTKYAANAMLATKISFMNELSRVCEKQGVDIEKVRQGIGSDPRIGTQFIYPGIGYGGSCFPKDVKALIQTAKELNEEMHLLQAVEEVNQLQRERFFHRIENHFDRDLKGKKFALWGLSFKPGTDDLREAPSLDLIQWLLQAGAKIHAHDPAAMKAARAHFGTEKNITFNENQYTLLDQADALCILTEWKPFREPNFEKMKSLMKSPVIFDGRNLFDRSDMKEYGFTYFSIGRPTV